MSHARVPQRRITYLSPRSIQLYGAEIGNTPDDVDRRNVENTLKEAALLFAQSKRFDKEVERELNFLPDYSQNDDEWARMQALQAPPISTFARMAAKLTTEPTVNRVQQSEPVSPSVSAETGVSPPGVDSESPRICGDPVPELEASLEDVLFSMCMQAVMSERHIGLDAGRKNFGLVVVDKCVERPPTVVKAVNLHLNLKAGVKADQVVNSLMMQSHLWEYMQQTENPVLPVVERVVVHVEQIDRRNADWRALGVDLAQHLSDRIGDAADKGCVVKLSQAHLHRDTGPVFRLGNEIKAALNLKPLMHKKPSTASAKTTATTASKNGI